MMWLAFAIWAVVVTIVVTAIILGNMRDARVATEYGNTPLDADDDKQRWTAVLTTKYRPNYDAPENFECKIKVTDATKKFKPIHGLAYGKTVANAEANAVAKLPGMLTEAFDIAEAPAKRTMMF